MDLKGITVEMLRQDRQDLYDQIFEAGKKA